MKVSKLSRLYNSDETAWLEESSRLIKEGRVEDLDYKHLREYLQDMARRDRREVRSRLVQLVLHLLKWQFQPRRRSKSWKVSVFDQRLELEFDLLSKSLRNYALQVLEEVYDRAAKLAVAETGLPRSAFPKKCPYSLDFVLGDKLPS
jgi:hypothetical protein